LDSFGFKHRTLTEIWMHVCVYVYAGVFMHVCNLYICLPNLNILYQEKGTCLPKAKHP
jgi:hypothetical protein